MSSPRDLEIINGNTNRGIAQVLALLGTGENGDENALSGAIIPAQLLNDYKLYGVDSFVYNTPALWETLLLHPYTANDRWANGDALEYVLTNPGKMALPAWLGMLNDTKAQANLFAGLTTAAQLAGNSAAMTALAASETAMYALTGSETMWAAVVASSTAMKAVAGSETAMQCVCGDEVAMKAVAASSTAMKAVVASSTAMDALAASAMAMKLVCESEIALAVIMASSTALAAVTGSSTAMTAVAANKAALKTIAENEAAMGAIEASSVAKTALAASPLKISQTYACNGTWASRNAKKLYLISIHQFTSQSNHYFYVRSTALGNTQINVLDRLCYGNYAVNRFMSKLEDSTSYNGGINITYTYIPLD